MPVQPILSSLSSALFILMELSCNLHWMMAGGTRMYGWRALYMLVVQEPDYSRHQKCKWRIPGGLIKESKCSCPRP